jgi:hypothetical protein
MGWGSWSITLKGEPDDTTPGSIWEILDPATNAYGHVLITPVRVDPEAVGDAGLLSVAKYAGIYRGNSSRNQIGGIGLVGWLGDEDDKGAIAETAKTGGAGSFANWIDDVIPDALAVGTVTAIAGTLTESMQYMSPRAMLARVMDYFGGVYRVNPDFTLDAGTEANLFNTTPTVLLKYNASGPDGLIRGIRASKIDLSRDLEDYTTRVVMLAEGSGSAVATGAANISPATSFVDGLGNAVVFKRLINAPDVSSGNANTLAAAQLGRFNDLRKSYSLSTSEWGVIFGDAKRLEPGDYIWVYDPRPDAALYDVANEITFHGETLMPVSMRLEAITWPIQEGMGVYFRYWNGTAFQTVDLSNHVVYETGESTLDVGASQRKLTTDLTPAAIQARIGTGDWEDWTPSFTNLSTVGGSTITARYIQIGKMVHCRFHIILGTTPTVGDVRVSLPVTAASTGLTALSSPLGTATLLETGVANNSGLVVWATTTTVGIRTFSTATAPDLRIAALSATVPFTWAGADEMHASWTYEAA